MIPAPFIQELLSRADIVEIIGRHVQLKKAGSNYKGLCPFHGEKTPSFNVNSTHQTYHCFGCQVHGNAIGFLMEYAGMSYPDAIRDLAQQMGLAVPEDDATPEERERAARLKQKRVTLTDVLEKAADHYRKQLRATPRAVDYLKRRGLTGEIASTFGIGFAPDGWRSLASAFAEYDDPLLEESGLVIASGTDDADKKRYDRFRDRIMFPIRSVQGDVIGFGGRVLEQGEPKYLNSPETPVFSKGRELYGLHEARAGIRNKGYALVVEGYMDVVALAQLGFPNAVATLGTACTADHVQKLFRFTESVVFSFDGDSAGRRAAGRALEAALPFATDVRSVKFLFLPAEHDPDSYVREHGQAAFDECVAKAVPLSRQLVEHSGDGGDLTTAEGRAKLLSNARPLWGALPDGVLKRQLLGELAQTGGLPLADLTELWEAAAQREARRADSRQAGRADGAAGRSGSASRRPPPRDASPPGIPGLDIPFDDAIASGAYDDMASGAGGYDGFDPTSGSDGGEPQGYGSFHDAGRQAGNHGPASGGWGGPGRGPGGQGGARGGWSGQRSGGSDWKGGGRFGKPVEGWKAVDPTPHSRRAPPASPADHALRMLLLHSDWWDQLGADDHQLLHELPQAHGQLCAWLERQLAEAGPTPWSALIAGLAGHELERLARRLVPSDAMEDSLAFGELRRVIDLMWIERLKAEETRLIAAVAHDKEALGRYRQVHERRRALEQSVAPATPPV